MAQPRQELILHTVVAFPTARHAFVEFDHQEPHRTKGTVCSKKRTPMAPATIVSAWLMPVAPKIHVYSAGITGSASPPVPMAPKVVSRTPNTESQLSIPTSRNDAIMSKRKQ